jgi:hypothetical protein
MCVFWPAWRVCHHAGLERARELTERGVCVPLDAVQLDAGRRILLKSRLLDDNCGIPSPAARDSLGAAGQTGMRRTSKTVGHRDEKSVRRKEHNCRV